MKKRRDLFGRRYPPAILDRRAPYWQGSTAEVILENRIKDREAEAIEKASKRRSKARSTFQTSKPSSNSSSDLLRRIRRLERNLPKRKTLVARQRIELEIAQIKRDLELA